jgi:hypothetical protein
VQNAHTRGNKLNSAASCSIRSSYVTLNYSAHNRAHYGTLHLASLLGTGPGLRGELVFVQAVLVLGGQQRVQGRLAGAAELVHLDNTVAVAGALLVGVAVRGETSVGLQSIGC